MPAKAGRLKHKILYGEYAEVIALSTSFKQNLIKLCKKGVK